VLGDVEEGTVYCGQIAGLIDELKSAKEVITGIIEGAQVLVRELWEVSSARQASPHFQRPAGQKTPYSRKRQGGSEHCDGEGEKKRSNANPET
jgi:hypothetical protein